MEKDKQGMVRKIRKEYGLNSPKVLNVMLQIRREKFVDSKHSSIAYDDRPIDIGYGQTVSQPYTVAVMTDLVTSNKKKRSHKNDTLHNTKYIIPNTKILEIGTGSGYQSAILSKLFNEVYSLEIIPELANIAKKKIKDLGIKNVFVEVGSGEWGWEEKSPYDAIMITAGIEKVPKILFDQLKVGGVLVAPIGSGYDKTMTRFSKQSKNKFKKSMHGIFHFVPFVEEKN